MRQHAAYKLPGHIQRVDRMVIEHWNDGENRRACIRSLLHVAQMNFVEWSFADAEGEGPAFLEADIGSTRDQIVRESVRDGSQSPHAAG